MSEGNAGLSPNGRTPVTDDRAPAPGEDDRPTAEMPAVGRAAGDGAARGGATPPAAAPSRPAAKQPGQKVGPQPTASGWTPPPLPGRQTPAPPAGATSGEPAPAVPKQAAGQRPPAQKPPAQKAPVQQPVPNAAAQQQTAQSPAAQKAPVQQLAAQKPAAQQPADSKRADPAQVATGHGPSTNGSAPRVAPAAAATTDEAAATGKPTHAKPSFWSRIADGLGFEKKTEDVSVPLAEGAAATTTATTAVAPTAAAARTAAAASATPAKAEPAPAAAKSGSGSAPPVVAPSNPGPQYRPGQPTPQGRAPGTSPLGTAPSGTPPVPGQPAPAGRAGSTVLAPAAAAGAVDTMAAGVAPRPVTRRTRKARLRLSRLDPWSVMKTSFLFSIAAGIMLVVAVYGIWLVLSTSGLFGSLNDIIGILTSTPGDTTPFRVEDYVNTQRVMGVAALIACVDVLIFTALATLGSFLYNLAATMLGGLEITLAED